MTTQTPATAEIEKWLRVRFSQIYGLGIRVRKKNAESCRRWLRHAGSMTPLFTSLPEMSTGPDLDPDYCKFCWIWIASWL